MFCGKCGQPVEDGAVFCAHCGSRINQPGNMQQAAPYGRQQGDPYGGQYCRQEPSYAGSSVNNGMHIAAEGAGMVRGAAGPAIRLKLLLVIAAVLTAVAVMLYLLFFKAGTPQDTIQKMEKALNELDQQELLECFDEQSQGIYTGLLGAGGDLLGVDLGSLSELAGGLGGYAAAAGLTPEFDLTIVNVEYTGDESCLVTVDFEVTYQGESQTDTEVLPMVKEGRSWVVSASGLQ